MKLDFLLLALGSAVAVMVMGVFIGTPFVFRDRVLPGVRLGDRSVTGVSVSDLPRAIESYATHFENQSLTLTLRQATQQESLAAVGVQVDIPRTAQAVMGHRWVQVVSGHRTLAPALRLDPLQFHQQIQKDFATQLKLPRNASLRMNGRSLTVVPAQSGESGDEVHFKQALRQALSRNQVTVTLDVKTIEPSILTPEVEGARQLASSLLRSGFTLNVADTAYTIPPSTIARLMRFDAQPDVVDPANAVLGVALNEEALATYLTDHVASEVNQAARDARFQVVDGRVEQFALPQPGRTVNIPETTQAIAIALQQGIIQAEGSVLVTQPTITDVASIESFGLTHLLARGESDFSGSPANRIHNITVGTQRYHGLLIPPGEEFSFLEFLGPVTREAGYKPELVIKNHQTIPEFGGGLCQVSTTLFRAAVYAGLPITERRNHAYAVRYYGLAGFDATIYPSTVDLKFRNDTPNYILIQARLEDTRLTFEFWGTNDGRQTSVEGPLVYGRQPDGAMKATLRQKVERDGEVLFEKTFLSRYRSPALYPKPGATPTPSPTPTPAPV